MTFFPPANPNAAYMDDDTGAVVKPPARNGGGRKPAPRNSATEPPDSQPTPGFFQQGSPNDFLDINPGANSGGSGLTLPGIIGDIWSGRGMFAGGKGKPKPKPQDPAPTPTPTPTPTQDPVVTPTSKPAGSRDVDRGGAKGTQTGPSPANFPALVSTWRETYQMKDPYSSINLPASPTVDPNQVGAAEIATGINAGKTVNVNDPNFQSYVDGEERIGTTETLITKDGSTEVSNGLTAATDGSRAIQTSLADALDDKDGMRSYMRNLYGGRDAQYDRRAAAFYNSSDDSMIALRAADLSQGMIKQNGKTYSVDAVGNVLGEITEEGANSLRRTGYGNANSEEFLGKYQVNAAAAQSEDSKTPPPATTDPAQQFLSGAKNILVENTNIAPFVTDTMRLARTNVTDFASGQLGMGVDGREPLMRSR